MYGVTVGHMMSETHPQSSWQPVSAEEFADWFDHRYLTSRNGIGNGSRFHVHACTSGRVLSLLRGISHVPLSASRRYWAPFLEESEGDE